MNHLYINCPNNRPLNFFDVVWCPNFNTVLLQNVYAEIKFVILLSVYFLLYVQLSTESVGTPNCFFNCITYTFTVNYGQHSFGWPLPLIVLLWDFSTSIEAVTHAPHRVHIATCVCAAASPAATIEDPAIVMTHQWRVGPSEVRSALVLM